MRRFINTVATCLEPMPDPEGHGRAWLDWARAKVEELDPMGADADGTFSQLHEGHGLHRWEDEEEETDEW